MPLTRGQSTFMQFGTVPQPNPPGDRVRIIPNFLDTPWPIFHGLTGTARTDPFALSAALRWVWLTIDTVDAPMPMGFAQQVIQFYYLLKQYEGATVVFVNASGTAVYTTLNSAALAVSFVEGPALDRTINHVNGVDITLTYASPLNGTVSESVRGNEVYILTSPGRLDSDGIRQVQGTAATKLPLPGLVQMPAYVQDRFIIPPLIQDPVFVYNDAGNNITLDDGPERDGREWAEFIVTGDIEPFIAQNVAGVDNKIWAMQDTRQINATQWQVTLVRQYLAEVQ